MHNMSGMSGMSGTTTTTTTTTTTYSTLCSTLVWNRVTGCAERGCSEITRLLHSPPHKRPYTTPCIHFCSTLYSTFPASCSTPHTGLPKLALAFLALILWH